MKWHIPAKTFLVGEYAAVTGAGAIILTTSPCFTLSLTQTNALSGISPHSPAGRLWLHNGLFSQGLTWEDPYQAQGGLGASSAQFLGAYLASCQLAHKTPSLKELLAAYYQYAWPGEGPKPSGYDLLAQTQNHCVFINRKQDIIKSYSWPFKAIAFLLLHSGQKLATHFHLRDLVLPDTEQLSCIVTQAQNAFEEADSEKLIQSINNYQQQLARLNLIASHSLKAVEMFNAQPEILAAKGCGALGADVLLLILPSNYLKAKSKALTAEGWTVLATSDDLYTGSVLEQIKNNTEKTLEILS